MSNVKLKNVKQTVVPENPIDVEITELVHVAFSGHVCDVALVPAIPPRVFPKSG